MGVLRGQKGGEGLGEGREAGGRREVALGKVREVLTSLESDCEGFEGGL